MDYSAADYAKRVLRKLVRNIQPEASKKAVWVQSRTQFVALCHRMEPQAVRMSIPIEKIRIQGAIPVDSDHPFVAAITKGSKVLSEFYDEFRPKNLAEMYRLEQQGLAGEDLPPWEIPWCGRDIRTPPPGEAGLDASHGVSFYGPGTSQKVLVEDQRLRTARQSIEKSGFLPEKYGDIEGYGLVSANDYRFFVRGGKHRLAALASLGWTEIPVSFRPFWPNAIFSTTVNDWPLVMDGKVAPEFALAVFERYFDVR